MAKVLAAKKGWGGARPGAGRRKVSDDVAYLNAVVDAEQYRRLKYRARRRRISLSQLVRNMIERELDRGPK